MLMCKWYLKQNLKGNTTAVCTGYLLAGGLNCFCGYALQYQDYSLPYSVVNGIRQARYINQCVFAKIVVITGEHKKIPQLRQQSGVHI